MNIEQILDAARTLANVLDANGVRDGHITIELPFRVWEDVARFTNIRPTEQRKYGQPLTLVYGGRIRFEAIRDHIESPSFIEERLR